MVKPGPKFVKGPAPLPQGWMIVNGQLAVDVCDFASFRPELDAKIFDDTLGARPACSKVRTYLLAARQSVPPDVLVVETIYKSDRKHELPWSGMARLTLSGCLIGLPLKKVSFTASFPAFPPGCPWFINGNAPPVDGWLTERKEKTVSLAGSLPTGSDLCSLSLRAPGGMIYYDDQLVLHLSNATLMTTSQYVAAYLPHNARRVWEYDWKYVVMRGAISNKTFAVCVDKSPACQMPTTETAGAINLNFDQKALRNAASWIKDQGKPYELTLVAIGDDDPGKDCRTSAITLIGDATIP